MWARSGFLALTLALLLTGCGDDPTPNPPDASAPDQGTDDAGTPGDAAAAPDAASTDAGDPRAEVWRALRDLARDSADHRVAEAERLVAARDLEGLFRFVRDRIGQVPLPGPNADRVQLWGPEAALRGGLGTPYEKAALLAELLRGAGFAAEIYSGNLRPESIEAANLQAVGPMDPEALGLSVPEAELESWRARLGLAAWPPPPAIDPEGELAAALAEELLALLPAEASPYEAPGRAARRIPFVEVSRDGQTIELHPGVAGAQVGERHYGSGRGAVNPLPVPTLRVRVWARQTPREGRPEARTLVELEASAADLAGRTLVASFAPPVPLGELLLNRLDDLRVFQPALVLARPGDDDEAAQARSASGAVLTLAGDELRLEGDEVWLGDEPVSRAEAPNPGRGPEVRSLSGELSTGRFPELRVRFDALDADGARVDGLDLSELVAAEDGARQVVALRQSRRAPRVVFVLDLSTSVPEAFRGAGARALLGELASELESVPGARARVVSLGGYDRSHPYVRTSTALLAQFDALRPSGSAVFEELAATAEFDPDLVIFVGDGQTTETAVESHEAEIAAGGPVLALGVGTVNAAVLERMAALSGGQYLAVDEVEVAKQLMRGFISGRARSYELRYAAARTGTATRSFELSVSGSSAAPLVLAYRPPSALGAPDGLVGLYLEVTQGGRTITRRLGGLSPAAPLASATTRDLDEVHAALLAGASLRFEAGPPSATMVLDEILTRRLRAFETVTRVPSLPEVVADLELGRDPGFDPSLWLLGNPLGHGPAERTFPTELRVVLERRELDFERTRSVFTLDILPFGGLRTIHPDPAEGHRLSLRRTLEAAVVEAVWHEESTASLLAGQSLRASAGAACCGFAEPALEAEWQELTAPYRSGYHLVLPSSGRPRAFYAVRDGTGEALAVLPDGSGGGREEARARVERAQRGFQIADQLLSLAGVNTGFWVRFELAKAKVLARATLAIIDLEGFGAGVHPEWSPERVAAQTACGTAEAEIRNIVNAGLPPSVSRFFSRLDAIHTIMTGNAAVPSACSGL